MSRAALKARLADAAALLIVVAALLLPDRLTSTDFGSFAAIYGLPQTIALIEAGAKGELAG